MARYRIMTPKKRNAGTAGSLFVSRNSAIATAGATSAELWTPRKYIHSAGKHSSPRDRMMAQIRRNALRKRGSRFQRRIVRINRATAAIAAAAAAAYMTVHLEGPRAIFEKAAKNTQVVKITRTAKSANFQTGICRRPSWDLSGRGRRFPRFSAAARFPAALASLRACLDSALSRFSVRRFSAASAFARAFLSAFVSAAGSSQIPAPLEPDFPASLPGCPTSGSAGSEAGVHTSPKMLNSALQAGLLQTDFSSGVRDPHRRQRQQLCFAEAYQSPAKNAAQGIPSP